MLKSTMRSGWVRLILAVLGSLIYALGINLFVTPLGLYTGGLMGFCQLLRTVILSALGVESLPFDLAGILFYAVNIPLLAIAWRSMGPIFFRRPSPWWTTSSPAACWEASFPAWAQGWSSPAAAPAADWTPWASICPGREPASPSGR